MERKIEFIKQNTYENKKKPKPEPEALIPAQEKYTKRKIRYKEWKTSAQDRNTK